MSEVENEMIEYASSLIVAKNTPECSIKLEKMEVLRCHRSRSIGDGSVNMTTAKADSTSTSPADRSATLPEVVGVLADREW